MNITELDNYRLSDAVKFHNRLNPRLWDESEHLRPEVKTALLDIAADFQEFLGVANLDVKDITVSGSNAAYNYTPASDIDLHLVVDLPEADRNEVFRELFDAKKYQYNDMHNITIGGFDVELYVQDPNQEHHSQGIYSLLKNNWVSVPKRRKPEIDDVSVRSKAEDLAARIDDAVKSNDYQRIADLHKKIKTMRQSGLEQQGEYGSDNLAFKVLRNQGYIKKLIDARNAARDAELSLQERKKKKKKVRYGFGGYWAPGFSFGSEGEAGGDGGGGESMREDNTGMAQGSAVGDTGAQSTWDGVSPDTQEFLSETDQDHADLVHDFILDTADKLQIRRLPKIQLHHDPEWSQENKSFGMYKPELHELHVSLGNRHLLDILRTTAHELAHCAQHQRESLPDDAGETGSRYENQAHAVAGVIMRDYADSHPELFMRQEIEEGIMTKTGAAAALAAALAMTPAQAQEYLPQDQQQQVQQQGQLKPLQILNLARTLYSIKHNFTRAGAEEELNQEFKNYLRAQQGDPGAQNQSRVWQMQQRRQQAQQPQQPWTGNQYQREAVHEASGYIPTTAEKNDPRFVMALSPDVQPGATGKNANKMSLKTDSQGRPGLLMKTVNLREGKIKDLNNPRGPETPPTMPAGTVRIDVSDMYDWYKLGQHISNMKGLGKHDFGSGPPSSVISFGDEETEHKFIKDLEATGLGVTDIDPKDPKQPAGMRKIKTDPTYNVDETVDDSFGRRQAQKGRTPYYKNPDIEVPVHKLPSGKTEQFAQFEVEPARGTVAHIVGITRGGDRVRISTTTADLAAALVDAYNRHGFSDKYIQRVPLSAIEPQPEPPRPPGLKRIKEAWLVTDVPNVDEGWKDVVAGGALALGALGAGAQTMPNMHAQQVELTNKYYNALLQRAAQDGRTLDARTKNFLMAKAQDAAAQKLQQNKPQSQTTFPSQGSEKRVAKDINQFESQDIVENDIVESLRREFALLEDEYISEIRMSTSNLRQLAAKTGARAGMEFEMIVPDVQGEPPEPEYEPDEDMDRRTRSFSDIEDFFNDGDYNSRRDVSRLMEAIDEAYQEWKMDQVSDDWISDGLDYIREYIERYDLFDRDEALETARDEIITANPDLPTDSEDFQQLLNARINELEEEFVQNEFDAQGNIYNDAFTEFTDDKSEEYDQYDFLRDNYPYMTDIESGFDIQWPYYIDINDGQSGEASVDEVAEEFSEAIDRPVNASTSYHGARREPGHYVVEPDGSLDPDSPGDSGLEFVSPPLPIDELLSDLNKVKEWASMRGCYTNDSTGLHINISVPDYSLEKLDYVKLALLMGDEYVLDLFGRSSNTYAKAATGKIRDALRRDPDLAPQLMNKMRGHMEDLATKAVHSGKTDKYTSINTKSGYIEFRSPGGDWLDANFDKIENTLLRFTVALSAAIDPEAYRQEYLKKLYKLLNPEGLKDEYGDMIEEFSKYMTTLQGSSKESGGKLSKETQQAIKDFRKVASQEIKQKNLAAQLKKGKAPKGQKYWWNVQWDANRRMEVVAGSAEVAKQVAAEEWDVPESQLAGAKVTPLRPYEEPTPQPTQTAQTGNWGIWLRNLDRFSRAPGQIDNSVLRRFPSREAAESWIESHRVTHPNMRTDIEVREIEPSNVTTNEPAAGGSPAYTMTRPAEPGSNINRLSQTDIENRLGWGSQESDANYEVVDRRTMQPVFYFIANTYQDAIRKYGQYLDVMMLPQDTEDYGFREIALPGSTIDLHRRRAAQSISQQSNPYQSVPIPGVIDVELDIPMASRDAAQGGLIDVAGERPATPRTLTVPGQGQQVFTGEWDVVMGGEVVFRVPGENQGIANQAARQWILNRSSEFLRAHEGQEIEVVPRYA